MSGIFSGFAATGVATSSGTVSAGSLAPLVPSADEKQRQQDEKARALIEKYMELKRAEIELTALEAATKGKPEHKEVVVDLNTTTAQLKIAETNARAEKALMSPSDPLVKDDLLLKEMLKEFAADEFVKAARMVSRIDKEFLRFENKVWPETQKMLTDTKANATTTFNAYMDLAFTKPRYSAVIALVLASHPDLKKMKVTAEYIDKTYLWFAQVLEIFGLKLIKADKTSDTTLAVRPKFTTKWCKTQVHKVLVMCFLSCATQVLKAVDAGAEDVSKLIGDIAADALTSIAADVSQDVSWKLLL